MSESLCGPNFFVAGAPKSGTTSLCSYLKTHPQCYFPELKEPTFFCDDDEGRYVFDMETYLSLYDGVLECHSAIGDGSVSYLASRSALRKIYEFSHSAKIIVVLRHPVDMFFSLYQQNLFTLRESTLDPVEAWNLQNVRSKGRNIPRGCKRPMTLQYRQMVSLGTQMARLYETFPNEQVLVRSFRDFCEDTKEVYRNVLEFLGLEWDGRKNFAKENASKLHRSFLVAKLLYPTAYMKMPIYGRLLTKSRHSKRSRRVVFLVEKLLNYLRVWNTRPWRPHMDPDFVKQLNQDLAEEVELVNALTGIRLRSEHTCS